MYESERERKERERSDQILDGAIERVREQEEKKRGLLADFLYLITEILLLIE